MSCVIAVLLTSVARLVITSSEPSNSYYGVYVTPKTNEFPVPRNHHRIHMSASKIAGPGTYVVAYCSIEHQRNRIIEIITGGRPEITQNPGEVAFRSLEAESACFRSISRGFTLESTAVHLSTLNNGKCTHKLVASLAFKGIIGIEGEFSCFAPLQRDQPIKVNADIPFDLQQFLSGGVLLRGEDNASDKQALVWFQGNLHLLKQTLTDINGYHSWSPITSIGSEIYNGEMITNFIYDNLPSIEEFTKIMGDFKNLISNLEFYHYPHLLIDAKNNVDSFIHANFEDYLEDFCLLKFGLNEEMCARIANLPDYLNNELAHKGLLCQPKSRNLTPSTRGTECIFRPAILEEVNFVSGQWQTAKSAKKVLVVPPQSNLRDNAERFKELYGRGTMCKTAA
ncbi:BgTH12-02195 [Blumeria graminis f. sp. triticale]|uniref:BgTH12-02195 n=1 Tax=Blumeria graminis f. sp. triticale TaxID=1689686 RepID=A0A9W4GEN2_BLUGR|nr:BgTH12-02195 [Blumeria graminis f. sp. triticale]